MNTGRNAVSLAVAAALAGFAVNSVAGGFGIGIQSGSATGNAVAGGAAVAEDASVVWSNPAAMMHLASPRQVTMGLNVFKPSFKYQDSGSTGVFAAPGTGEGGDGGDWAYVPNAFGTFEINPRIRVGLAVNVPFGLVTHYDQGWRGQLTALKSKIETINLNPAIAFKINDMFSVGAGVSVQRIKAELSSFSGVAALGNVNLSADDTAWGFNLGATFQPIPSTRLGVSYRSTIDYNLTGDVRFTGPGGAAFNGDVRGDLKVPDMASFSVFHTLNPQWELMGDVTWTGWDSLQQLVVVRTTTSAGGAAGSTFSTLQFQWRDTWRYSVGANYRINDRIKLRFGLAYDETPTKDSTRTPRLPDQDRKWAAFGVQWKTPWKGVLDVGYAHEFIKDASVNVANPPFPGSLIGRFENKADIFSVQYSHPF